MTGVPSTIPRARALPRLFALIGDAAGLAGTRTPAESVTPSGRAPLSEGGTPHVVAGQKLTVSRPLLASAALLAAIRIAERDQLSPLLVVKCHRCSASVRKERHDCINVARVVTTTRNTLAVGNTLSGLSEHSASSRAPRNAIVRLVKDRNITTDPRTAGTGRGSKAGWHSRGLPR